jgi:hypothetical protein
VDDVTTRQSPAASPATAPSLERARASDHDASAEPVVVPEARSRPTHAPATGHEVRIVDGRFAHAECSCGWRGDGRRTRSKARAEARDHALLYATADVRDLHAD